MIEAGVVHGNAGDRLRKHRVLADSEDLGIDLSGFWVTPYPDNILNLISSITRE